MCEVAERLENKGRAEGRAEGRTEGREEIIRMMLRNGKTAVQIADFCGIDLKEVKKVEETIK